MVSTPATQAFNDAHANSDVDFEADSMHHTLGDSGTQAAPGNHSHEDLVETIINLQDQIDSLDNILDVATNTISTLLDPNNYPTCRATTAVVVAVATGGAGSIIPLETEDYDNAGLHSLSATALANTKVICNKDGRWSVAAKGGFAGNVNGRRVIIILKNGVEVDRIAAPAGSAGQVTFGVTNSYPCTVGDFFQLQLFQDSGGALNTLPAMCTLTVSWENP